VSGQYKATAVGGISLGRPGELHSVVAQIASYGSLSFVRYGTSPQTVHEIDPKRGTVETFVNGKRTVKGDDRWQWHFDDVEAKIRRLMSTTHPQFNQQQEMFHDGQDQDQ
jgi:hypothetical protein